MLARPHAALSCLARAKLKLLLVDDHPLLREGVAALLQQSAPGATILQAATADEAFALALATPDLELAILDLLLPGQNGQQILQDFTRRHPRLPVLVLSSSEDPLQARRALQNGACGYVPKSASPQTLLAAIELVLNGDIYVPPLILNHEDALQDRPFAPARPALTARQLEILRCLGDGASNNSIAQRLNLSEKTVKAHVSAVFKGLNVSSRTQAVSAGRAAGLL
jgi:DNA-binding NarL/FixJ family response regulator